MSITPRARSYGSARVDRDPARVDTPAIRIDSDRDNIDEELQHNRADLAERHAGWPMNYALLQEQRIGMRDSNQDYALHDANGQALLPAVADGMGGYHGGELAPGRCRRPKPRSPRPGRN